MPSVNEDIKKEFLRHQGVLDDLFQKYIEENLTIPVGTTFIYGDELSTVVGAVVVPPEDFSVFLDICPKTDIWLLLDIPSWRIEGQPEAKVTFSLGRFLRAVETGYILVL